MKRTVAHFLTTALMGAMSACGGSPDPGPPATPNDAGSNTDSGEIDDVDVGSDGSDASEALDAAVEDASDPDPDAASPDSTPVTPGLAGVFTDLSRSIEFLYAPGGPQIGVAPGAIDPQRVAVLRGRVVDTSGAPLAGVNITLLGHPELGRTESNAQGEFSFATNGGPRSVLDFQKVGLLPVQRAFHPGWRDWAVYPEEIVMSALDPQGTMVAFGAAGMQVARGSMVADAEGMRQATVLFPSGVTAAMRMGDGSTVALSLGMVRATEYTVGDRGKAAMPGELPPLSGYTYAVELSVDEALAAGAVSVEFSEPLIQYVDNFLNFPAGIAVPLGYYDRQRALWVPSPDGVVMEVLGVSAGLATVDADGDGLEDDATIRGQLGMTDAERATLATLYPQGGSLWRVRIPHFTPYDCNWPYRPPYPLSGPPPGPNGPTGPNGPPCPRKGSIIGCEDQGLGEVYSISGTPFALSYDSKRVPGRRDRSQVRIVVSGDDVQNLLRMREMRVFGDIAGQVVDRSFAPALNLTFDFEWDGLDGLGRPVYGPATFDGVVEYRYEVDFVGNRSGIPAPDDSSFNSSGGGASFQVIGPGRDLNRYVVYSRFRIPMSKGLPPDSSIGGWELDAHHVYSPSTGAVVTGRGEIITGGPATGVFGGLFAPGPGVSGRLLPGPILNAPLPVLGVRQLVAAPDGALYFLDDNFGDIWRVTTSGQLEMAVGCVRNDQTCIDTPGDGQPGDKLGLHNRLAVTVHNLAVGPDNVLYFTLLTDTPSGSAYSLWRLERDRTITRIAGSHEVAPTSANPIPADFSMARDGVFRIGAIAAGPNGSAYFILDPLGSGSEYQIMRVGPDGRLTRIAGYQDVATCPFVGSLPLDIPAVEVCLKGGNLRELAVSPGGDVYFAQNDQIFRVDAGGILSRFAGSAQFCTPSDVLLEVPAEACLQGRLARNLTVGPDDRLYALLSLPGGDQIVRFDAVIQPVAGGTGDPVDGARPRFIALGEAFALSPTQLVVSSEFDYPVLARFATEFVVGTGPYYLPEPSGRAVWDFDAEGRHLATRDVLTGAALWTFGYDSLGRLESVTDRIGRRTSVERDGAGAPSAIVAPGGERTLLAVDANGWLSRITDPKGGATTMTYLDTGGLLSTLSDREGRVATYRYDDVGRLVGEDTPLGGSVSLVRRELEGGHEVDFTADGETTTFRLLWSSDGIYERSVFTGAGAVEAVRGYPDGRRQMIGADGTVTDAEDAPDPRFGFRLPYQARTTTRKGTLQLVVDSVRTVTGGRGYFGDGVMHQTTTVGGRSSTQELDGDLSELRLTSPAGRTRRFGFDALGRPTALDFGPGLAPQSFTYGPSGQLAATQQGAWDEVYEYDPTGRLSAVRVDQTRFEFGYDVSGMLTALRDPFGEYSAVRGADGMLTSFSLPGGAPHQVALDARGDLVLYQPPGNVAGFERQYHLGGALEQVRLPSGRTQVWSHLADGRLEGVSSPEATLDITYGDLSPAPASVTRTPASGAVHTTQFTYQGNLPIQIDTSGATSSSEVRTYGSSFLLVHRGFTSGPDTRSYTLSYDDDFQLLGYGPLSYDRSGPDRRARVLSIGAGTVTYGFSPEGKLASREVVVSGTTRYQTTVTYGDLLLPSTQVEVLDGSSRSWTYNHDAIGRLVGAERDGAAAETYGYDVRGNRTSAGAEGASYDGQDRLQMRGGINYTFDVDGFLSTRGSDAFHYSTFGELLSATVGGVTVTYDYDAFHRLVRRTDSGQSTEFYYQDPIDAFRPSAYRAPGEALTSLYWDEFGHLVALERDTLQVVVATDLVGTPRMLIDANSGAVLKTIDRDSYGRRLDDSAPGVVLPIGFAGGIEDPRTGLVRFGRRDYDPEAGRFTARDPLLLDGGQFNFYAYAHNSPVAFRDPTGLFCIGGSIYAGIGGGGKFCIDDNGLSACAEAGLGAGTSLDVQPMGGLDKNAISMDASGKVSAFGLGLGCEASFGVENNNFAHPGPCSHFTDEDCKVSLLAQDFSLIKGASDYQIGALDVAKAVSPDSFAKAAKIELQAKVAAKGCRKYNW